ncbi:alpha-glucosidase [Neomicrococcus aestuarii]|uniref:Alpha-glucosidase n=1 Tax=Neomicrococcus aestuarii TaxID=556325 RepID=A0A7W8WZV6_9MICC|nr:glycoside hydrolase family 13 protein [Neomicrococcus aestuarii]MBB5512647.1 alpha-glucosidase [Neomicrococcus aestuarii]
MSPTENSTSTHTWWKDAVIYQVYPRSFADSNGDGMGDLNGVRSRIPYLKNLGVDAVWLSPFYTSPQNDAGYDVADYRNVDERFGTLADFDTMLATAHEAGLKVIVDLVPNHTSDQHVWFQEALASEPGSVARERYIFRDGKGENGDEAPNDWQSVFGGDAWTRVTEVAGPNAGKPGQWYLHLFDTTQPDLNWDNTEVRAEMESVLEFWLDRGVDGFRVDVAHGLIKHPELPDYRDKVSMVAGEEHDDAAANVAPDSGTAESRHFELVDEEITDLVSGESVDTSGNMMTGSPYFDQEGVHQVYREWNEVLAKYDGDRMMVAEAWVEPMSRIFRYVRSDEMQQAFNFGFLLAGWDAQRIFANVDETLREAAVVQAPATWVLSNHDTVRHSSRFGLSDPTTYPKGIAAEDEQPDERLGWLRGRAAAMIMLALPGSSYVYQGDELSLPEHTTLPHEFRQDPSFFRTNGEERGRDGCRIPMPWDSTQPGFGFDVAATASEAPADAASSYSPWLPQPESYRNYAADRQVGVEGSTFELYRALLAARRERGLGTGELAWAEFNAPEHGILAFTNGTVTLLANTSSTPVDLPEGLSVLFASHDEAVFEGQLAADSAVWLEQ